MAKGKFKAEPKFSTPVGTFKYPHLLEPDYGNDEYPDPDGSYKSKIVLKKADPAVQALLAALQPMHDAAVERARAAYKDLKIDSRKKLEAKNGKGGIQINTLFTEVYDEETEEPTGDIEMSFKMKASGISKKEKEKAAAEGREPKVWRRKPDVFDSGNPPRPLPKTAKVWGGSTGIIAFTVGVDQKTEEPGYFVAGTGACGLSLRLAAAQVITLVSGGERSASDYGFGAQEGGFSVSDLPEEATTTTAAAKAPAAKTEDDAAADEGADDGNF